MKRLVVLAGLAAMLVGTAACSGPTKGQPTAAPTVDSTGQTTSDGGPSDTSTSAGGGTSGLPVDQPCSLLSSSDLTQLGVSTPPTSDKVGTAPDCSLDTSGNFTVGIALRTTSGLSDFTLTGGSVHTITVGSHSAKQGVDNTGSCNVAIGVSSSSRVDVTALGDGNADPCPTALAVARLIEPKLP